MLAEHIRQNGAPGATDMEHHDVWDGFYGAPPAEDCTLVAQGAMSIWYNPAAMAAKAEKPPAPKKPRDLEGLVELACAVCHRPFYRTKNIAPKAKVCTNFGSNHKAKYQKMPDGQTKKIPCACCLCIYKKTLAKKKSFEGKVIPSAKINDFLKVTRKLYGENVYLAFRLGLNAMLRVQEIASLKVQNFKPDQKPLPQLDVIALKKKVEIPYPVDIDPSTAAAIKKHIQGRAEGSLFGVPKRTLQHKFTQVMKALGIPGISIHSLRHTGIWNRARSVTNLNDLNYLRQQARHESIETTKGYLGYEQEERLAMAKKVKWF